ncbi:hypothetical protein GOP47_0009231 [Adiantum capillus-veneris]|uniref:Uncharacterized protein n=1 Tax=Adiantum capillus-veneris TaxID=13818 RepID=A0A9D4UWM0_ADICA|nr:hypothetical protein GOP47_0009231 [Adiantum capillus-veneris]
MGRVQCCVEAWELICVVYSNGIEQCWGSCHKLKVTDQYFIFLSQHLSECHDDLHHVLDVMLFFIQLHLREDFFAGGGSQVQGLLEPEVHGISCYFELVHPFSIIVSDMLDALELGFVCQ